MTGVPHAALHRFALPLLFLLAFTVRVLYALVIHPDALIWQDEVNYDRIAWQLAQTGRYESPPYDATPGWPALVAAVYVVAGHSVTAVRVVQALLGGVLVVAVTLTGTILFDRRRGLLAGAMTALYPPLIYLSAVLYADHLAAVLIALTVCTLAWWRRDQLALAAALAGLLLGVNALTRPVYLLLVPVAAAYLIIETARMRRARAVARREPAGEPGARGETGAPAQALPRQRHALLLCAVAGAVVLPWTVRNAIVHEGRFVPVATGFGLHLWRGNNELARGNADDRHLEPLDDLWHARAQELPVAERARLTDRVSTLRREIDTLHPVDQDARLRTEALRIIGADPLRFVRLSVRRLVTLYSPFSRIDTPNHVRTTAARLIAALSFLPVLALGLAGAVLTLRAAPATWIVHATVLMPTLVYAVLTAATRFRLPIDTLWILLASFSVITLLDRVRFGRRGATAAPA